VTYDLYGYCFSRYRDNQKNTISRAQPPRVGRLRQPIATNKAWCTHSRTHTARTRAAVVREEHNLGTLVRLSNVQCKVPRKCERKKVISESQYVLRQT
jgi:hypothetical protein